MTISAGTRAFMSTTTHGGSMPVSFYGKLPARADFVGRRLPHDFVDCWDAWLQQSLATSEAALGLDWRDCYFAAPLWRFVLPAEICGSAAVAGVMMPSVDAVGRSFPLMLGRQLAAGEEPLAVAAGCSDWFEAAEVLAIETLYHGFDFAALDRKLAPFDPAPFIALPTGKLQAASSTRIGVWLELPMLSAVGSAVGEVAGVLPSPCLWWTTGSARVRPGLAATPGLIPPEAFAALLDGRWAFHGWSVLGFGGPQPAPVGGDEWDREA